MVRRRRRSAEIEVFLENENIVRSVKVGRIGWLGHIRQDGRPFNIDGSVHAPGCGTKPPEGIRISLDLR